MINIFSMDRDHSTDCVIDWLSTFKVEYKRINLQNDIDNEVELCVHINEKKIKINNTDVNDGINWMRKLGSFNETRTFNNISDQPYFLIRHIQNEINSFKSAIGINFENWLCNPNHLKSKIEVLHIAKEIGLKIPETYLVNSKKMLKEVFNILNKEIIVKPLTDVPFIVKESSTYFPNTELISEKDIEDFSEFFVPSLVQNRIKKNIELRIFFVGEKYFSAAIFSQNDEQTKVDFRNYNYEKPNRLVPFNLPEKNLLMLKKLMGLLKLNTGSIDMILNTENEYYFLEVNPAGQFGMISGPCNFYIEKEIANYLILNEKSYC